MMKHIAIVVVVAACNSGSKQTQTTTPPLQTQETVPAEGSGSQTQEPVPPGEGPGKVEGATPDVSGYWTGDWGQLVLRQDGANVRGVYKHDKGTIVGTMQGTKLVGWWCETPSRKPTKDAGDVELAFVAAPDGTRAIDGKWRYGTEGAFKDDWDLKWNTAKPDADLVKRFDDAAAFCTHP